MNFFAWYDSKTNDVILKEKADAGDGAPDYVITVENGYIEVQSINGEKIQLNEHMQTVEEAVILFTTLLGLREAAR